MDGRLSARRSSISTAPWSTATTTTRGLGARLPRARAVAGAVADPPAHRDGRRPARGGAHRPRSSRTSTAMTSATAEAERYGELIDEVAAVRRRPRADRGPEARGWRVVLASSAKAEEAEHYVDLLDAREVVHGWTTSADVDRTKPEPDLVAAAMRKAGALTAVMVGDTVWDVEAARRADIKSIGMLTGGLRRGRALGRRARRPWSSRRATCWRAWTRPRWATLEPQPAGRAARKPPCAAESGRWHGRRTRQHAHHRAHGRHRRRPRR